MKQRYTIGNYVKISQLDEQGNVTILLAEAEMPRQIIVGRTLRVRHCERYAEWKTLGVVSEVRNYKKHSRIDVFTGKYWYALEVNAGLESVMTDYIDFV